MVSAPARRALIPAFVERGISMRRACALLGVPRSTLGYVATQQQHHFGLAGFPEMNDTRKILSRPAVRFGVAIVAVVAGTALTLHWERATIEQVGHDAAISAEQRARIVSLATKSLHGVEVVDTGQGPYGMSWAVLAKGGTRQVAWVTPGEPPADLPQSPAPTSQPGESEDFQFMPVAAPGRTAQPNLDHTGTNLQVAAAFLQVKDSFFSIPLFGDGSGGDLLVLADPDCHFCHDLLRRLNASAADITKRGIRVRWYPVGVLRPQNGYSLQRAAAQLQSGPAGLLAGGVVSDTSGVTQESLRRVAMNTKALGEISPRQILTPTVLFRNHNGQSVIRLGAPTNDEQFFGLINEVANK